MLARWIVGVSVAAAVAACSSASDGDDGASSDEALGEHDQTHITPGVELARQTATNGSTVDKQRASVHFGHAYWLARFSMLSYWQDHDDGIRQTVSGWGFDGAHARFFVNTCTAGYAIWVPAKNGLAVLAFRGTLNTWNDWLNNLDSGKVEWAGEGLVHSGFKDRFLSLWEASPPCGVDQGLREFLASRPAGEALYVTGHSLGAALATLTLAYGQKSNVQVSALYTFGSPRVGDEDFAYAVMERARGQTAIYRFVNADDIVTSVPTDIDPVEALLFTDYRHLSARGEDESVYEVWVKDRQLEVATTISHGVWSWEDHLAYEPPLEFQARAHNQLH